MLPAFIASVAPAHAFLEKVPDGMRAAAARRYPEAVAEVCASLKRSMASKLRRHITASGGQLERRVFDMWDVGNLALEARFLTLFELMGLPEMSRRLSVTFPREIAATSDGDFGAPDKLLALLGVGSYPAEVPVYRNRFLLANDLSSARPIDEIGGCGDLGLEL